MKKTNCQLLVALCMVFVTFSYAQHKRYTIKNGFALGGGLTQYDILTDNLNTTSGSGWLINASTTADIPHKWYNISFGMQLSENNIEIAGLLFDEDVFIDQQLEYKLFAAQLAMLLHAKLIKNLLTIDVGPMLQYNGKMELQNDNPDNLFVRVNDDTFEAIELEDISQFNVNGAVGATLGFQFIKLRAQYIYGFTNMLNKLNDKNLTSEKFKGNQSMLTFAALITF
ncbi:hypothetical protein [Winogradskyella sp.]|uniref:hypothetical protein n=1 Tax=Winogradskyella sp. TaxID=1883156 RepID=UPI00261EBFFF|nr:hypothetical protein [Winogradskyella sp.]